MAGDYFSEMVKRRTTGRKPRGFMLLSPEAMSDLCSKAGKRRAELGVGHKYTTEEATVHGLATGAAKTEEMLQAIGADPADFESREQMEDAARKYGDHRQGAADRGIGFEITFSEWWRIWKGSGKWDQRGTRSGMYVMARNGDSGPYRVGNVRIATCNENCSEIWTNRAAKAAASKG